MKLKNQKLTIFLMIGAFSLLTLAGCSSTKKISESGQKTTAEDLGTDQEQITDETELEDLIPETFRPSDIVMKSEESYEYPFMGLKAVLPKKLMEQMDEKKVAMLPDEDVNDDGSVKYAFLSWSTMTEEQKNAEVAKKGMGYFEWVDSLKRIGTLGVYHKNVVKQLDKLTGCTKHQELGKSSDGTYFYYLSTNSDADQTLTDEIKKIKATITEMTPSQQTSAFSTPKSEAELKASENVTKVAPFETTDINDKAYTEELFEDYDLTMINVFATWCSPCVNELPDLEKLHQEMKEKGVNVVGIVMDAVNENGEIDDEGIKAAKILQERAGITYPLLIPDASNLNGRISRIEAYPETFFVDKNGNIVGETYSGSSSLEEWREIVNKELIDLKGE